MDHGVVGDKTTRRGFILELLDGLLVRGEDVEGERFGTLVDKVDGLVEVADRDDGEDGTKDLVLHDGRVVWIGDLDDGGGDVKIGLIRVASEENLSRSFDQVADATKVTLVDDPSETIGGLWIVSVHLSDDLLELLDESRFHRLFNEDVIRRDARLPAVEVLSKHDSVVCCFRVNRDV